MIWFFGFFFFSLIFYSESSGKLDLRAIKRQQTRPSGTTVAGTTTTEKHQQTHSSGTTVTGKTTTESFSATTTPVKTTAEKFPCNVGCQDGWIPYGENCYTKIPTALTQLAAEQQCNTLGAHLASFETASEANAVKKLVLEAPLFSSELLSFMTTSQESWIGLAKETNGAWTWTDSSSVEFTNLPDGTSAPESSCVYMNTTGHWQPKSCSSTTPSFICKQTSRIAS